jgi:hypothetical protein
MVPVTYLTLMLKPRNHAVTDVEAPGDVGGGPFDHVRSQGNQPNVAGPTTFAVTEAEQLTKLRKYQISQFRTAFKDAAIHNVRREAGLEAWSKAASRLSTAPRGRHGSDRLQRPLRLVAGALFGHPRPA